MNATVQNALSEQDLSLTQIAQVKMAELIGQVDENIEQRSQFRDDLY